MWDFLRGIQDQVTKYSTWLGKLWYLCVFVFRVIVFVTFAGPVFGGGLDEFSCNTIEPGCTMMCFNEFNQMSPIRFWSFQLLAVAAPTMIFHLSVVAGQIQKVQEEEVRCTKIIHIAYIVIVILRPVAEGVSIYFGHQLFSIMDQSAKDEFESARSYFLPYRVPAMYKCAGGRSADVEKACRQSVSIGGTVPCWVSRPWEKSILISYMNILSGPICFLLSCLELIYLLVKRGIAYQKRKTKRTMAAQRTNISRAAPIYGASYHPKTRPIFDRQSHATTIRRPYRHNRYAAAPTSTVGGYNPEQQKKVTKKPKVNSPKQAAKKSKKRIV